MERLMGASEARSSGIGQFSIPDDSPGAVKCSLAGPGPSSDEDRDIERRVEAYGRFFR